MHEAVVASEQHDLVMARFEYALRAGPYAEGHQYLREKARDVAALAALSEGPTVTLRLAKKRAPVVDGARRVSRQQSK
jgi:hypothetical protein